MGRHTGSVLFLDYNDVAERNYIAQGRVIVNAAEARRHMAGLGRDHSPCALEVGVRRLEESKDLEAGKGCFL